MQDRYKLLKHPSTPPTDEEVDELLRKGKYVGGTLIGTGALFHGVSKFVEKNASPEKLKALEKNIKATNRIGLATAGAGTALLGTVHSYKHYKDRKKKEEEKAFSVINNEVLAADLRLQQQRVSALSNLMEGMERRRRAVQRSLISAQRGAEQTKYRVRRSVEKLDQSSQKGRKPIGLSLVKTKTTLIKPKSMGV